MNWLTFILLFAMSTFALGSTTISESNLFAVGPNSNWVKVITLTTTDDGASSYAQTLSMYVTALPEGGDNYRVAKTVADGNWYMPNPVGLSLGTNDITVGAVDFDRTVIIQFSSADVEFNSLIVNGVQLYPVEGCTDPAATNYNAAANAADGSCTYPVDPAGITISESSYFINVPSSDWVKVIDLALLSAGPSSQFIQTLSMNVIALPEGGADYRVVKTVANGNWFFEEEELSLGTNDITVGAVGFDRTVKIQFSSADVEFNSLIVNGVQVYPVVVVSGCMDPAATNYNAAANAADGSCTYPVDPPGITISESSYFINGPSSDWVKVIDLALLSDGASSRDAQTLSMTVTELPRVTELPVEGANYRVYKSTENGQDFLGNAVALTLGVNQITVGAVGFDRAVKIQFSSGAIRFSNLEVNGTAWVEPSCGHSGVDACTPFVEAACSGKREQSDDGTWKQCVFKAGSCTTHSFKFDCSYEDITYDGILTDFSAKRGLCLGKNMFNDQRWGDGSVDSAINAIKVGLDPKWLCSFGVDADVPGIADSLGVSYIPQIWGKHTLTYGYEVSETDTDKIEEAEAKKIAFLTWAEGACQVGNKCTVLTFNEPTLGNQADMSVAEAVTEWNSIKGILNGWKENWKDRMAVATPCQASANAVGGTCEGEDSWKCGWLAAFLEQVHPDDFEYHCVHRYVDGAPTAANAINNIATWLETVKGYLDDGKPIVVKEYGWKGGPENCEGDCMLEFQREVQLLFEADPRVKLYAQFTPDPNGEYAPNFGPASRLINKKQDEKLYVTNFGQNYRTYLGTQAGAERQCDLQLPEACQRQCASGGTEACAYLLNSCSCYDPCADKAEGASCFLCDPTDNDCAETEVVKTCQSGDCA